MQNSDEESDLCRRIINAEVAENVTLAVLPEGRVAEDRHGREQHSAADSCDEERTLASKLVAERVAESMGGSTLTNMGLSSFFVER